MWCLLLQSAGKPNGLLHILATDYCSWDDQGRDPAFPGLLPPSILAGPICPSVAKWGEAWPELAGQEVQPWDHKEQARGQWAQGKRCSWVPGGGSPSCLPVLVPCRCPDLQESRILGTYCPLKL